MISNEYDFKLLETKKYHDSRGAFLKDFVNNEIRQKTEFKEMKEIFYTFSKKNVIRGMHFQRVKAQAKLITCIKGEIFDVIVDLRKDSPHFGEYFTFHLSENKNETLYVPRGFAHGYLVIKDSVVVYKCDEKFIEEYDDGIIWNDSVIDIKWPINFNFSDLILSDKDLTLQSFQEFNTKEIH